MKVALYELENHFSPAELEEAMTLVRETHEFSITQPEEGYYHCISRQPDYHVELAMKPDSTVTAKCQCTVFKKAKECRHALAALLLLRDHILRKRKGKTKSRQDTQTMEDVLRKVSITELRSFLAGYALSHSGFRSEFLATYLHRVKKPDYHRLLSDIIPIDKYGQVKLNRNQVKSVRNILTTLLKQAQHLLKEKALAETLIILDACLHHLYRLLTKVPQYQEQLTTELKLATRLFDALCHQTMAPRLQQSAITLALEISSRENYIFLKGLRPLLSAIEPFVLEEKDRQAAFSLAEKKTLRDTRQQITWACQVMRLMRLWGMKSTGKEIKAILLQLMPEVIQEFNRQGDWEDVIGAYKYCESQSYSRDVKQGMLKAAWRACRHSTDTVWMSKLSYELSLTYLDIEGWESLFTLDHQQALRVLRTLHEYYQPGDEEAADQLLLTGYRTMGMKSELLDRLLKMGDLARMTTYDAYLKESHSTELIAAYAAHILEARETYGGTIARQKLSNIFGHLKSIDLYTPVSEKIKQMEKNTAAASGHPSTIRGFVFDLDGVIVDTAIHHFQSWKKIMHELGAEITEEDDHHTRGASRMESLEYLLQRYGITMSAEDKEMWAARKNDIYLQAIEEITPRDLLPGALAFLIDSRKAGLLLALGSASKNARGVLRKLGIEDRFDAILDGNDAKESKPHPEIFTKASLALHLDPSEVVVFEDAAKGVQAAVAAGCKVVGLGHPDTLSQADIIISGLDQATPSQIIDQLS